MNHFLDNLWHSAVSYLDDLRGCVKIHLKQRVHTPPFDGYDRGTGVNDPSQYKTKI
jgi:hypothetical protein